MPGSQYENVRKPFQFLWKLPDVFLLFCFSEDFLDVFQPMDIPLYYFRRRMFGQNITFFINLQRFSVAKTDKHGRKRLARLVQRSVTTLIIHVLLQEEQSIEMVGTMENCYYGKALSNALLPNTLKSGSFKFSQGTKQR